VQPRRQRVGPLVAGEYGRSFGEVARIQQHKQLLAQLGLRLRDARQAANLTVREVGEQLGVDHSMIVRYENGVSLPPLDRLMALAELYDVTPAALLARHAAAVSLITAIDRAEEAALASLAALLDASDDGR